MHAQTESWLSCAKFLPTMNHSTEGWERFCPEELLRDVSRVSPFVFQRQESDEEWRQCTERA